MKDKIEHYTLKEIHEQSAVVQACLDAFTNQSIPALGEHIINLGFSSNFYLDINQIQIIACGSSLYASLVGKYLFEQVAKVPTIVHDAAEFRDAPPPQLLTHLSLALPSPEKPQIHSLRWK
jgi:glucosamine--fructose-6-phosphate aminotransferase (isomerizing)